MAFKNVKKAEYQKTGLEEFYLTEKKHKIEKNALGYFIKYIINMNIKLKP